MTPPRFSALSSLFRHGRAHSDHDEAFQTALHHLVILYNQLYPTSRGAATDTLYAYAIGYFGVRRWQAAVREAAVSERDDDVLAGAILLTSIRDTVASIGTSMRTMEMENRDGWADVWRIIRGHPKTDLEELGRWWDIGLDTRTDTLHF